MLALWASSMRKPNTNRRILQVGALFDAVAGGDHHVRPDERPGAERDHWLLGEPLPRAKPLEVLEQLPVKVSGPVIVGFHVEGVD